MNAMLLPPFAGSLTPPFIKVKLRRNHSYEILSMGCHNSSIALHSVVSNLCLTCVRRKAQGVGRQ